MPPYRPIPSQMWCKYAKVSDLGREGEREGEGERGEGGRSGERDGEGGRSGWGREGGVGGGRVGGGGREE